MADVTRPPSLDRLAGRIDAADAVSSRPVELCNPPFCGEIDLRIAADGTWFYGGTPILRPALVKLFASILRKDPERYVLVTPVEMVAITVEDAPFIAVELRRVETGAGATVAFRTNLDEWVSLDGSHPLRFEREASGGMKPYLKIRGELWAKLARPVFYELAELGEIREIGGERLFGIASAGCFFPMASAAEIEEP